MNFEWFLTHLVEFVLTAVCGGLVVYIRGLHKRYTAMEDGMKALLRASIFEQYRFYKARGYCELDERAELTYMYNAYKALGGNDVASDVYGRVLKLPTEDTKEPGFVEEEIKK